MITGMKHISIREGEQTMTEDYALIKKKDRAGFDGRTSCVLTVNAHQGSITSLGLNLHVSTVVYPVLSTTGG